MLLLIREIVAVFNHIDPFRSGGDSRHSRHADSRTTREFVWSTSQALLAARTSSRGMAQRRRGTARAPPVTEGWTTLGSERVARAVEFAEVGESLAAGAVG